MAAFRDSPRSSWRRLQAVGREGAARPPRSIRPSSPRRCTNPRPGPACRGTAGSRQLCRCSCPDTARNWCSSGLRRISGISWRRSGWRQRRRRVPRPVRLFRQPWPARARRWQVRRPRLPGKS